MTKRYVIEDNKAIVDTETMTPNGIPTKIFVAEDPFEANKICNELNEQDQQIKQLKKEKEILKHWNKWLAEKRHNELKCYTHQDCIHYCEKLHDEYECGEGHWWWETSCDNDGDIEEVGVCENFEKK